MPNQASLTFVALAATRELVEGKSVVDIGSKMGAGLGPYVKRLNPGSYRTVDIRRGPGVDFVCDVTRLVSFVGSEMADLVLCTEVLEHVRDWRTAIHNLKEVCKAGGRIILTTRSPGYPPHGLPDDYWRFTEADMLSIFADFEEISVENDDCEPGVFVFAQKPFSEFIEADLSKIAIYSVRRGRPVEDIALASNATAPYVVEMYWLKLLEVATYALSKLKGE